MASDDFPEYMNTAQTQRYTGLGGLATRRSRGTSPPYIKTGDGKGARVLYSRECVDRWMAERTRKHTSEHSAGLAMAAADAA